MSQKFCNILVVHASLLCVYHMTKAVQTREVPTIVGSIMIVGVLTCCVFLHFTCDLKTAQINVQHGLIWELYKFEMVHLAAKATKNICSVKK